MRLLKRLLFCSALTLLITCNHKNSENESKIEPEDFLAMFPTLNLPVNFADSSLSKKHGDSLLGPEIVKQFISDTLFQKQFGKSGKPRFYAAGKLVVKKAETYLFIKALGQTKKVLYLACLDPDLHFKTGMPLVIREEGNEMRYASTIDNKYAVSISQLHRDAEGKTYFVRAVYIDNPEGVFTLIMMESNQGKPRTTQVYNPIDTLSKKHKFTGDYIQDKRNFISFRDGKNNSVLRFFVHFEKDNGNCKGELKGEARFVSSSTARYLASGDPCSLEFNFSEKNVRMKELEGCGNHRDIRCYFDGVYLKHKEPVAKPAKSRRR